MRKERNPVPKHAARERQSEGQVVSAKGISASVRKEKNPQQSE